MTFGRKILMSLGLLLVSAVVMIARTDGASAATLDEKFSKKASPQILVMLPQSANRLRPGEGYSSGYGNARRKAAKERLGRQMAKQYGLQFDEHWPMPLLGIDCFVMTIVDDKSAKDAALEIGQDPAVSWAEPMHHYYTLGRPSGRTDPLYSLSPAAQKWRLADLHKSWTGRNVSIAVIDTQVDVKHPDLVGRIAKSRNFAPQLRTKPERHGTGVAGIIAATANNGIGIAGVAPGAEIMALRACWQRRDGRSSLCNSLSLARALNYAIERKVNIINLSLGGPKDRLLAKLIDVAVAKGIAVVAAYDPRLSNGGFPASHNNVIAVSADNGSSTPGKAHAAPGVDVPTTQPGGRWYFVNGSSYAAAHVSGLLALMRERYGKNQKPWQKLAHVPGSSRAIDARASLR